MRACYPPAEKNSSLRGFRMLLYSTGKDASKEKWDGAFTRFADVVALFGADDARPLDTFVDDLRSFVARAEHVYADLPAPARHPHNNRHRRHHQHHHHQQHRGASGTRLLLKYLARGQPFRDPRTAFDEAEAQTYLDVIAASQGKRRPLEPLVGALRSIKSGCEVEVMKASAEISARAHAKVSLRLEWCCCVFFLADGRVVERRCDLLSLGCLKRIFMRTLSISVRGAVRSVLRTSPLSHPGRSAFTLRCAMGLF